MTLTPCNGKLKTIENCIEFLRNNLISIKSELKKHAVILFRDFPVNTTKDFNDFALAFSWENFPYIGGAALRTNFYGVVFTVLIILFANLSLFDLIMNLKFFFINRNEGPNDIPIVFHHEMAHLPMHPSNIFFYCDLEPKEGGETQFCLSNEVYNQVKHKMPQLVEKLENKRLKYVRILPEEDDPNSLYGIKFALMVLIFNFCFAIFFLLY